MLLPLFRATRSFWGRVRKGLLSPWVKVISLFTLTKILFSSSWPLAVDIPLWGSLQHNTLSSYFFTVEEGCPSLVPTVSREAFVLLSQKACLFLDKCATLGRQAGMHWAKFSGILKTRTLTIHTGPSSPQRSKMI